MFIFLNKTPMENLVFIDLFAGAGGVTDGAKLSF